MSHWMASLLPPQSIHEMRALAHPRPPREIQPDILGEIFGWVIPPSPLEVGGRDQNMLLHLLLVCRAWYEVALQTHELWNRLSLSFSTSYVNSPDKLAAWFRKAGTTYKTLRVTTPVSRILPLWRPWGESPGVLSLETRAHPVPQAGYPSGSVDSHRHPSVTLPSVYAHAKRHTLQCRLFVVALNSLLDAINLTRELRRDKQDCRVHVRIAPTEFIVP
ncbi:hypothetical protein NMY22_g18366 [Coprinellus aureogranulatus]|nr:hypothetical protein NMY22_g18366 [Coprinellus aureogranulatus]